MRKQLAVILQMVVSDVYKEYQKRLRKNQALDFDDLIMKTIQFFNEFRKFLNIINENSNISMWMSIRIRTDAQYMLVKLLAARFKIYVSSGTRINRFTDGAARILPISFPLKKIIQRRKSSSWNKTTVQQRGFLQAANEVIANNQ